MSATVYLIPTLLAEDGLQALPLYLSEAIKKCQVFFVENERTTRRFLKQAWKTWLPGEQINIEDYRWYTISEATRPDFRREIKAGSVIGILSEAGCPGIADPGQALVAIAQELKAKLIPLSGPSSIFLALMASGMNGQQFKFFGYLPVESADRARAIRELETESAKKNCTQVFIETPYRNNQLLESILQHCQGTTRLCIAANMTSQRESVVTMTIQEWKNNKPELHKQPVIFCLQAKAGALT